jgi:hypothetical protein
MTNPQERRQAPLSPASVGGPWPPSEDDVASENSMVLVLLYGPAQLTTNSRAAFLSQGVGVLSMAETNAGVDLAQ